MDYLIPPYALHLCLLVFKNSTLFLATHVGVFLYTLLIIWIESNIFHLLQRTTKSTVVSKQPFTVGEPAILAIIMVAIGHCFLTMLIHLADQDRPMSTIYFKQDALSSMAVIAALGASVVVTTVGFCVIIGVARIFLVAKRAAGTEDERNEGAVEVKESSVKDGEKVE